MIPQSFSVFENITIDNLDSHNQNQISELEIEKENKLIRSKVKPPCIDMTENEETKKAIPPKLIPPFKIETSNMKRNRQFVSEIHRKTNIEPENRSLSLNSKKETFLKNAENDKHAYGETKKVIFPRTIAAKEAKNRKFLENDI